MIHGYHVILPVYGFWLPNDPRGSWSEFVWRWELVRFGRTTRTRERRSLKELNPAELAQRDAARKALKHPAVTLNGFQAQAVGRGFELKCRKSNYTIWACSILPEHAHLVIARHTYKVEQIVNLLKGAATRQLIADECHPLANRVSSGERPPRMWAEHEWKVYLDSEDAIETAIHYVEENPVREGKPKQQWSFVTAFREIAEGGWTTYH
jgi:REP element-mobilizing transposase RayT